MTDYETLSLTISPTWIISENGGTTTGTVTRNNTDRSLPLTVNLASSDTSEATVPGDGDDPGESGLGDVYRHGHR